MGDIIKDLKTDSIPIDLKEQDILQRYFPEQYSKITRNEQMILQLQNLFFLGLLFFILDYSLTQKHFSFFSLSKHNHLLFSLFKSFLFILILYIILNIVNFISK